MALLVPQVIQYSCSPPLPTAPYSFASYSNGPVPMFGADAGVIIGWFLMEASDVIEP